MCVCVCVSLQKFSEKVGGDEGTKLDDDFKEMEKVRDIMKSARDQPITALIGQC